MRHFWFLALFPLLIACSSGTTNSAGTFEAEQRHTWIGRTEDDLIRVRGKPTGGEQLLNNNRLHIYRTEKKPPPDSNSPPMGMMGLGNLFRKETGTEPRWCEVRFEVSGQTNKIVAVFVQGNSCVE